MKNFFKSISLKEIIILVLSIIVVSIIAIVIKDSIKENTINKEINNVLNVQFNNEGYNVVNGEEQQNNSTNNNNQNITVSENAVAVIQIPSVGIQGVVKEGTDNTTLKNYIGMFKGAAYPGQIGNFSVAAHYNIYTELFKNLPKVKIGDEIKVITRTETYKYKVTSKQTVSPSSIEVITNKDKAEITLITCNYNATARLVVKGELIQ